jgi:hypothetical protein
VAQERHYGVVRVRFPEPQAMSPLAAGLYRWWYRRRDIPANRLLIESFVVMEPVGAVGAVGAEQWQTLFARARKQGGRLGAQPATFPLDFLHDARYHRTVQKIPARHPLSAPLPLSQLEAFLDEHGDRYRLRWQRLPVAG